MVSLSWGFLRLSEIQAGLVLLVQAFLQTNLALHLLNAAISPVGFVPALLCIAVSLLGVFFLQRRVASGLWRGTVTGRILHLRRTLLTALGPGVVTAQTGLTAVITGGNAGIGFETTRGLLHLGFDVYMLARSEDKARDAIALLQADMARTHRKVVFVPLDLADDTSVRRAAMQLLDLPHIDVLINNAGMFDVALNCRTPPSRREKLLQVNFFGVVLLTELLLPKLLRPGCSTVGLRLRPRIVNVSSIAQTWASIPLGCTTMSLLRKSIDPAQPMPVNTYGLSKLLVTQYTKFLALRTRGSQVDVCSLHPGAVLTDIFHSLGFLATVMHYTLPVIFKTPAEGALTTLHCVATQSLVSGAFYADGQVRDDVLPRRCFAMKEADEVQELVKRALKMTALTE